MITKVTNPNTDYLNRTTMYQLFLRSFTPEGTLRAAEKMLPYLSELGIGIIYLCPCFKADEDMNRDNWSDRQKAANTGNPKNPYRISDYFIIDEEYGTMEDFASFVDRAHSFGMKVALDLVFFHCGPRAVFLDEHPDFIMRLDNGEPDFGQWHFPKLNFESAELREYLWENMCFYVREYGVDGFRCDVGDAVPLDFWAEGRRRLEKINPAVFMLNEGVKPDYLKVFDLNYETGWGMMLFKCMMADKASGDPELSELLKLEKNTVYAAWKIPEYWQYRVNVYEENGTDAYRVIRGVDNHDTVSDEYNMRKDKIAPPEVLTAELAFCILIDGVPFLYNGVEIKDSARHSIFSNKQYGGLGIDWSEAMTPEGRKRFEAVKTLISIRKNSREAAEGETVWLPVSDKNSVAAFARKLGNSSIVVYANFTSKAVNVEIGCGEAEKSESLFLNSSSFEYRDGKLFCSVLPHGCGVVRISERSKQK